MLIVSQLILELINGIDSLFDIVLFIDIYFSKCNFDKKVFLSVDWAIRIKMKWKIHRLKLNRFSLTGPQINYNFIYIKYIESFFVCMFPLRNFHLNIHSWWGLWPLLIFSLSFLSLSLSSSIYSTCLDSSKLLFFSSKACYYLSLLRSYSLPKIVVSSISFMSLYRWFPIFSICYIFLPTA